MSVRPYLHMAIIWLYVAGILVGYYASAPLLLGLSLVLPVLAILVRIFLTSHGLLIVYMIFFVMGLWQGWVVVKQHHSNKNLSRICQDSQEHVVLYGIVDDVVPKSAGVVLHVCVDQVDAVASHKVMVVQRPVFAYVFVKNGDNEAWFAGDKICAAGVVREPWAGHEKEYEKYQSFLLQKNIILDMEAGFYVRHEGHEKGPMAWVWAQRRKCAHLFEHYAQVWGAGATAIVKSVLLGMRGELNRAVIFDFKNSGTYHLFAISGLNVMLMYMVFLWFFMSLRLSYGWGYVAVGGGLIFYAVLSGLEPSVVRATLMAVLVLLFRFWGRPLSLGAATHLAMFVLLLLRPEYLFDVGFQLSFLAVYAIVWLQPVLHVMHRSHWPRVLNVVIAAVVLSIGITALTWPVLSYHFGIVTWIAPLANLCVVPVMDVVMLLALGIMALHVLGLGVFLPYTLGPLLYLCVKYVLAAVEFWAKCPSLSYTMPVMGVVFYYAVVLGGLYYFSIHFSAHTKSQRFLPRHQ